MSDPAQDAKVLVISCTQASWRDSIGADGHRSSRRLAVFDVSGHRLEVDIEHDDGDGRSRRCTRIHLDHLFAMEWRGRTTLHSPRWSILSWACQLALEMQVGETRRVRCSTRA